MGKITRQTLSEIRQLPLLLGKLLGGIMAAIGFPAAVYSATRKVNLSLQEIMPYLVLGILGIVIFVASSRTLARRISANAYQTPAPKDKIRMNILAWVMLLIFAAIFLLFTFMVSRQ